MLTQISIVYETLNVFSFAYDGEGDLNSVEMLDIETRSWLELPSMLQKRNGACCCIFEKSKNIFVLGGMSIDSGVLDSIERFSMVEQAWALINVRLVRPLRDFVCHSIGKSRLLILGSPD